MLKRSDRACFQEEREVLVKGMIKGSPWITQLHYTFQDEKFLYFVMKFYNGGDMLTMLSKFDDQIPEDVARFYLAELVLAINSLHELGYVHRDIKPDNVLLETSGHIVLTDFGSCLRIGQDGLIKNTAAIGTPDYIAPEILRAAEDSHGTFGVECDYWSLGVVMYEMLFGETPFYSENLIQTYSQIMNFEKTFRFPEDEEGVSDDAKDLLKHFICDRKTRYGRNGIEEIAKHPFFIGIDWQNIRSQRAPYQPEVKSPEDTSNFDIEESARTYEGPPLGSVFRGCQVACIGFTFTKDSPLNQIGKLVECLKAEFAEEKHAVNEGVLVTDSPLALTCSTCPELKARIHDLESELQTLMHELEQQPPPSAKVNGVSVSVDAVSDKLAAAETHSEELVAEVKRLQSALGKSEALFTEEEKRSAQLSKSLAEEREKTEHLKFDIREYEEENEDLCKRIQETSSKLRDKEAACERLLNDLDEKRAELAAQRKLLDEYIQQQSTKGPLLATIVASESNHSNGFSTARTGDALAIAPSATIAELELKLRDTIVWAEECEAKMANQEAYWADQKLRWQRERSDLQDRIREIVLERTSFLECELRQERQRCTAMEQRVMVWENQLVELIAMADSEWAVSDNLHDTVLHLMSELQRLRNGSPDITDYEEEKHRSHSGVPPAHPSPNTAVSLNGSGSLGSADWRLKKAGRISKMERSNLQLALNNEIREREIAQQRVRELEIQLEEATSRLAEMSDKLLQTEKDKEILRDQLVKVTNEVRRSRMRTAEVDESAFHRAELLNGTTTSSTHAVAETTTHQNKTPLAEKSVSLSLCSGSASGSGGSVNTHKLISESFNRPTKCLICSSLLLGQQWQGLRCQQCGFVCHLQCRQAAASLLCNSSSTCSTPEMPSFDADVACGLGTILEGPVKTPKGDIKRGWIQQYAYLCDMRLFIYDCNVVRRARQACQLGSESLRDPRGSTTASNVFNSGNGSSSNNAANIAVLGRSTGNPSASLSYRVGSQITYETAYDIHGNSPAYLIDINASGFYVSRVTNSDVIHAKRNEVPLILKVVPDDYAGSSPIYLLFDNLDECGRWFSALDDAAQLVSRNFARTPDSQCLQLHQLSDASFPLIKHILSACVLDEHRILVGTEDGLYTVDLRYKIYARIGEKKPIHQVEALPEELQLVAVIQDKQRRLRLILTGTIEGMNYEKIRVSEPKSGVNLLAHGWSQSRTAYLLCAASSCGGSIWVYEIVREASRHRRLLVLAPSSSTANSHIQALCLVRDGDALAVGFESSFFIFNIWAHGSMNDCGIYVDSQGQLTRQVYFFWPAKALPRGFVYRQPYLYVFTEAGLFLFNVETSTWITSAAGSRRLRLLNSTDGHICLMSHYTNVVSQGISKLVTAAGVNSSGSGGSATGMNGSNGSQDVISGLGGMTSHASLVYIPPPRQSVFASVQRRRTNTSILPRPSYGFERQLELDNIALLDSATRPRKSRRFSLFSRGNLFPGNTENSGSDGHLSSAANGNTRLISAPSDFQHVAHQGPDVRIHLIDLAQSKRAARYSTGNFSLAVENQSHAQMQKQSFQQTQIHNQHQQRNRTQHRDSQVSLHSTDSSRQSTDQSLGDPDYPTDPMTLTLPVISASNPNLASPIGSPITEETITPSAVENESNYHHRQPPPSSLSMHTIERKVFTPSIDSPGFRDKVLALFHTEALTTMDYHTCDAMKKLNALKHQTNKKIENLNELKRKYCETYDAKVKLDNYMDAGELGSELRALDNRLDKAKLKCEEADHIYRAYKEIKNKLVEEQLTFPACLENLENQIKESKKELDKILKMHNDALLAQESAKQELRYREEINKSERKRRENELSGLKQVAETLRKEVDFSEKKRITALSTEEKHSFVAIEEVGPKEEQLQKLKHYEEMYRQIRDVTGVKDVTKMVSRFESQIETMKHLNNLKDEGENIVAGLEEELKNLKSELDELKYSGEADMESKRKLVEEYKAKLNEVTAKRDALQQQLDDLISLLVRCKAGMVHICDKLEDMVVNISEPRSSDAVVDQSVVQTDTSLSSKEKSSRDSDKSDQIAGLINLCSEKVKALIESLKDYDYEEEISKVDLSEKQTLLSPAEFFQSTKTKIPEFNLRVNTSDVETNSAEDDGKLYDEEEDDGTLSRIALKKESEQLIEMRTKKRIAAEKGKRGR
nr:Serine/threonine-protein kinase Genghis Khan [Hymenolepis microstoma]